MQKLQRELAYSRNSSASCQQVWGLVRRLRRTSAEDLIPTIESKLQAWGFDMNEQETNERDSSRDNETSSEAKAGLER